MLNDPAARAFVGAIAVHGYGGQAFPYAEPAAAGKEFWVTELDDGLPGEPPEGPYDPGMGSGLKVARKLHTDLTVASVNAWHYWWIAGRGDRPPTNAALTDGTTLTRRAHVMGNFSKFVRPGFVRVEATGSPQNDVLVTAFRDEPGTRLVIVATNVAPSETTQRFVVRGATLDSVTPWVTSEELALAEHATEPVRPGSTEGLGGADGDTAEPSFTYDLPARSVTTFVGELTSAGAPEPEPEVPTTVPRAPLSSDSGCSCDVAGRPEPRGIASFALLGLLLLAGARRRPTSHLAR
jgi:MYXO-CTERM domain-containing protein